MFRPTRVEPLTAFVARIGGKPLRLGTLELPENSRPDPARYLVLRGAVAGYAGCGARRPENAKPRLDEAVPAWSDGYQRGAATPPPASEAAPKSDMITTWMHTSQPLLAPIEAPILGMRP